jgi:hypothetical protein
MPFDLVVSHATLMILDLIYVSMQVVCETQIAQNGSAEELSSQMAADNYDEAVRLKSRVEVLKQNAVVKLQNVDALLARTPNMIVHFRTLPVPFSTFHHA